MIVKTIWYGKMVLECDSKIAPIKKSEHKKLWYTLSKVDQINSVWSFHLDKRKCNNYLYHEE